MKPLWQYWIETIFWGIVAIIVIFLGLSFIAWLVETVGGLTVLLLGLFLVATYVVACLWSVFDTNDKHSTPWFYKESK